MFKQTGLLATLENMSKLVPVKRPDRNGKLVTRHVKPEADGMQTSVIPAPSSISPSVVSAEVTSDEYDEAMSILALRVKGFDLVGGWQRDIRENLEQMARLTPDAFRAAIETISGADDYHVELLSHALKIPHKDSERFNAKRVTDLVLVDVIAELHPDEQSTENSSTRVRSGRGRVLLDQARTALPQLTGPYSASQCKAVVFAAWMVRPDVWNPSIAVSEQEDNIRYIAEHFDAVMERRDTIRERQSIDRDFIESVITTAPAVSGGAL